MFGLSLIEYIFHEFNKLDFTIDSLLTLSDLISKLKIVCADYDDLEKLRTICILIKSQWVLCNMKSIGYKIDHCNNVKEIDLKHVDIFLLNEIKFIEYHLNELEKYFSCNSNAIEIICIYRRHIIFIKKPIEKEVYNIWSSYLQTFTNQISSFKDILLELSPSILYQLSYCLNDRPQNTSVEISQDIVHNISFKKLRSTLGTTLRSREGLEAIHQLIQSKGVTNIIDRCTALRKTSALGVKLDVIEEMKNSFNSYKNLAWLYREIKSYWECVLSEDHLVDGSSLSSEVANKETIVSKQVPKVGAADISKSYEDINNTTGISENVKINFKTSKTHERISHSMHIGENEANIYNGVRAKRRRCRSDDVRSISERTEFKEYVAEVKKNDFNNKERNIPGSTNSKRYKGMEVMNDSINNHKESKSSVIKGKASILAEEEKEKCTRKTRSSDFSDKYSDSKVNIKNKLRRLLPLDSGLVDLDLSPNFKVSKIQSKVADNHISFKKVSIQKNNNSKRSKESIVETLSPTEIFIKESKNKKEIAIRSLVKKTSEPQNRNEVSDSTKDEKDEVKVNLKDEKDEANKSKVKATDSRRHTWSIDETYLIFKGVKKNMIWSTIKNAYFRQSSRTNCHIKDRWRVVCKNEEFMKTLETMFKHDKG